MKIIIFGHTGMLGRAFIKHFGATHQLVGISRKTNTQGHIESYPWEKLTEVLKSNSFDVAVNLCGETIGQPWHRWSRKKIYDSRVNLTKRVVNALDNKDIHLINAGGIGIYDAHEIMQDDNISEKINPHGFLQTLAFDWEQAANKHQKTTILRTAVVLKKDDGVLAKMLIGKQLKLLTQFGRGKNPFPWISIEDWCHALNFIINKQLLGPVNLTSPEISNYNDIMSSLCNRINATKIIVPNRVVKTLMGEMGESLFLTGSHALPKTLIMEGFEFKHPKIENIEI